VKLIRATAAWIFTLLCILPAEHSARATVARFPATSISSADGLRLTTQSDDDAALTGVQIFVSAGLAHQTRTTNGAAALAAECIVRTPVSASLAQSSIPMPVREAIEARGGSVTYSVDERTVHYYLESTPDRMPEVLKLFEGALAHPDFSGAAVAAARRTLDNRIAESEKNPFEVGVQMFRESFLQSGTAYPQYGTLATLESLGGSQVRAFYATTYRRGGMSVSMTGRVTPEIVAAVGRLAESLPSGAVAPLHVTVQPVPASTKRIIAQRDVARPFIIVGFGAPSPSDHDFGAMLVLEALLSSAFERSSATTLALGERSVGAVYFYDSAPASLVVYVNGGTGIDPTVALREVVLVAKSLATRPLGSDALKRFKAAATGEFVRSATTLYDRAYLIGMLASTSLGERGLNGALDAIDHASSADVQRVAKTYLQRYIVALIVPRQAQQE